MKNRKPTYSEQKAQLKDALKETYRRLAIAEEELTQLQKQGEKYLPDKEPPKTFIAKEQKVVKEIAALRLNVISVTNTMRARGMLA